MTCDDVKRLLSAYIDRELGVEASLDAEEHLRQCTACSSLVESQLALRNAIAAAPLSFAPPAALRARIRGELRREGRTASVSPGWRWATWAASLAVVGIVSWSLGPHSFFRPSGPTLESELVASHVRSLMAEHLVDVASSDQHTVKPWFNGKLPFSPPFADYASAGFPLAGGRLEYVNNRPAAALVYKRRQHIINVFVYPTTESRSAPTRNHSQQGYNVVTWTCLGFSYWAVSDVNKDELENLATLFERSN